MQAIPALVTEGWAKRDSVKELREFVKDAFAESCEAINHLLLAKYKGYIKRDNYADELIKRYEILCMMLTKFRNNWQKFI